MSATTETDTSQCEPLHFEGGPWDGLDLVIELLGPDVEIIELQDGTARGLAWYRRQGDSRTYRCIGEEAAS